MEELIKVLIFWTLMLNNAGGVLRNLQRRYGTNYSEQRAWARSATDSLIRELNDEKAIREFETQNPSHSSALSKYIKALISAELKTRGTRCFFSRISFANCMLFFSHAKNKHTIYFTTCCLQEKLLSQNRPTGRAIFLTTCFLQEELLSQNRSTHKNHWTFLFGFLWRSLHFLALRSMVCLTDRIS